MLIICSFFSVREKSALKVGYKALMICCYTRRLCSHFLLWFSVQFNPSEKSVLTIQSLTYFIALNDRSLLVIHDQQIVKDFNQLISG